MAAKTRQPKLPWTEVLPLLRACAGGPSPAKSLMDRHAKALKALGGLLWNDSVLGYGIAEKRTGGIPSGQFSVRFYVRNKVAKSRLKSLWRIPPILQLSHKKSGMPPWRILTDVVSMPEIPRLQRLLSPGQSIGHFSGSEGAIGVVVDGADGRFVLTCAHVAAPPIATIGDSIESPADNDKKPGPNTMGQLHAWFALDSANDNEIDAALIRPDPSPGIQLTNLPLGLAAPPSFANLTPATMDKYNNHSVRRFSPDSAAGAVRTVEGVLESFHNNIIFSEGAKSYRFNNVVSYHAPNQSGDSGSPVTDLITNELLGIHFAGIGSTSYLIPGISIANQWGLSIAPI